MKILRMADYWGGGSIPVYCVEISPSNLEWMDDSEVICMLISSSSDVEYREIYRSDLVEEERVAYDRLINDATGIDFNLGDIFNALWAISLDPS